MTSCIAVYCNWRKKDGSELRDSIFCVCKTEEEANKFWQSLLMDVVKSYLNGPDEEEKYVKPEVKIVNVLGSDFIEISVKSGKSGKELEHYTFWFRAISLDCYETAIELKKAREKNGYSTIDELFEFISSKHFSVTKETYSSAEDGDPEAVLSVLYNTLYLTHLFKGELNIVAVMPVDKRI